MESYSMSILFESTGNVFAQEPKNYSVQLFHG